MVSLVSGELPVSNGRSPILFKESWQAAVSQPLQALRHFRAALQSRHLQSSRLCVQDDDNVELVRRWQLLSRRLLVQLRCAYVNERLPRECLAVFLHGGLLLLVWSRPKSVVTHLCAINAQGFYKVFANGVSARQIRVRLDFLRFFDALFLVKKFWTS